MKTLKNEIVEALRKASGTASKYAKQYDKFALSYHEYMDQSIEFENIASKVESARCDECSIKDKLLKEMAEALEEIVRCLSHGLQDCRASVTAKAMLQKYHEQEATNAK